MSFRKNLIFFTHLLSLIINPVDSDCPPSFECGKLGTLEFPLTNRPECGLFMMDGCSSDDPIIQFGAGGPWYSVRQKKSTNKFLIFDSVRELQLSTNTCLGLNNVSLPVSPSSTFTISPNLTFFSCVTQSNQPEEIRDRFVNYNRITCSMFHVYYENPATSQAQVTNRTPSDCVMFQVPINPNRSSLMGSTLSDLLTSEYVIEWNVTDECYACHRDGGECTTNTMNQFHCERGNRTSQKILIIGALALTGLIFTVVIVFLSIWKSYTLLKLLGIRKSSKTGRELSIEIFLKGHGESSETGKELDIELFLKDHGELAPKRYSYSDLKKMTKSFGENLGNGGYGSVYKGRLPNGRLVAVKILYWSKGNGEEFINEVASISRTSHINVVTLVGFCFEDSKRALIYDFMPNGSLEKYIQKNVSSSSEEGGLGWEKLFEIALCVARGLDYLHEGCNTRILHFDIKPENILLDKDFNPKISDFGLAKLCPNRSTIVSMMVARGTVGYIAPEVFCSNFGVVSYKSDVYSYGMMVLEIAGEKKGVDHTSETHFPQCIYKQLELMDGTRLDDHGIVNEFGASELAKRKLITVGLWCIQTVPKDRPAMSKVVEMLEGKIESLQVPPKPYLSSPPRL